MANKALAQRQKLTFRIEPSQKTARSQKPRNPVAVAAHQRSAGAHRKTASAERNGQNEAIRQELKKNDEKDKEKG
jgi:hypothetical protein